MKAHRAFAVLIAILAPLLAEGSERFVVPRLVLESERDLPPTIAFSLPRYEMSPLERETIAACLILEAASQGEYGLRAVMAVIRNRARGMPELFALTTLREKQFSAFNTITSGREPLARAIHRAKADRMWRTALFVVDEALADSWSDPTGGATHYTRSVERTAWTRSLAKTVTIGAHSFYR